MWLECLGGEGEHTTGPNRTSKGPVLLCRTAPLDCPTDFVGGPIDGSKGRQQKGWWRGCDTVFGKRSYEHMVLGSSRGGTEEEPNSFELKRKMLWSRGIAFSEKKAMS